MKCHRPRDRPRTQACSAFHSRLYMVSGSGLTPEELHCGLHTLVNEVLAHTRVPTLKIFSCPVNFF